MSELLEVPMIDVEYWAPFPDLLSRAHLMALTKKNGMTVWRWLDSGEIPGHQIGGEGGMWIVYKEEFQRRLEQRDVRYPLPLEFLAQFDEELSKEDLMRLFGRSSQTVNAWLAQGVVPGHRLGRGWLIYKREVAAMLERTSNQL